MHGCSGGMIFGEWDLSDYHEKSEFKKNILILKFTCDLRQGRNIFLFYMKSLLQFKN